MNAIEHLESQHGDIEDLFHELGLSKDVATKSLILSELGAGLVSHAASERRLLAALMAKHHDASLLASSQKHRAADRTISALLAIDPENAAFDSQLARLQDSFEACVEYEETVLFPLIRGLVAGAALPVQQRRANVTWRSTPSALLRAA
jgi:hypothetical protein